MVNQGITDRTIYYIISLFILCFVIIHYSNTYHEDLVYSVYHNTKLNLNLVSDLIDQFIMHAVKQSSINMNPVENIKNIH